MVDFTKICKIYIIESQNPNDILNNRTEGKALSAGLDLAGIANQYFQVIDNECFDKCIEIICEDINRLKKEGLVAPYIHISAHGNESGIGLTSGEFLEWDSLTLKADRINELTGKIQPDPKNPHIEISPINYCFSTCQGYNAFKMQGDIKENKFSSIIGPAAPVDWSDSLLAFMTLYHQIFYKRQKAVTAVEIMNMSAGLDNIFRIAMGFGLVLK
ncbi:hypothetical protein [Labilibaculum antarcticum]|uniref:Uncharacterized protein n=1 Tax=Labilibaculum antarcticum TaxID=1717717 RepID=A0A1Y1CQE5_9BACT|nr:hypothetical protein [Labilibaculum antarcticum]BAX81471.1 hypothetical protein ALGA_3171 [Labilibaculum antarcticum]